jgi:hypothetical protein
MPNHFLCLRNIVRYAILVSGQARAIAATNLASSNATRTAIPSATEVPASVVSSVSASSSADSSIASASTSTSTSTGHTTLILLIAIPALIVLFSLVKRVLKHRAASKVNEKTLPVSNIYYINASPPAVSGFPYNQKVAHVQTAEQIHGTPDAVEGLHSYEWLHRNPQYNVNPGHIQGSHVPAYHQQRQIPQETARKTRKWFGR